MSYEIAWHTNHQKNFFIIRYALFRIKALLIRLIIVDVIITLADIKK